VYHIHGTNKTATIASFTSYVLPPYYYHMYNLLYSKKNYSKSLIFASLSFFSILIVDTPGIFAIGTFIKYRLSFIDGSQLHGIVAHLWMIALDAGFFNRGTDWFLRSSSSHQCRLFGVALGPNRCGTLHGIGRHDRFIDTIAMVASTTRGHFGEIGLIVTNITLHITRGIDFECHAAMGTKWPRHAIVVMRLPYACGSIVVRVWLSLQLFSLENDKRFSSSSWSTNLKFKVFRGSRQSVFKIQNLTDTLNCEIE
jgi:hypothetical protein